MIRHLHTLGTDVRRRFEQLRRAKPAVVPMVAAASALLFLVYIFIALADEITEGETQRIDEQILLWFRQVNDHALPIGPRWLADGMLDATALGSPLVLGIIVATASGFLFMEGQRRVAMLTVLATAGGGTASLILKWLFARPRPEIVPHLRQVTSSSFPSGHAMLSAVVYLTIGVMFMKAVRKSPSEGLLSHGRGAAHALGRVNAPVFLGVHYPSDVLGGWIAGVSWASLCWIIGVFIPTRPIPERSDVPPDPEA